MIRGILKSKITFLNLRLLTNLINFLNKCNLIKDDL